MSKLQELKADYLKAQDERTQAIKNNQQKSEEINQLKLQVTETKERLVEIERLLNNARNGIGMSHSADELLAFKKELADKKDKLDYLKAQDERTQAIKNNQQKSEEINQLKLQVTETKERLVEIERLLNNARNGIGMSYSADELLAFKKELADKKDKLDDFQFLLPLKNNELQSAKNENMYAGRKARDIYTKITEQIITEASSEIATAVESQLKFLVNMILSETSLSDRGTQLADYIYREVGYKLCQQVLPATDCGSSVVLPPTDEAKKARDVFIESLE